MKICLLLICLFSCHYLFSQNRQKHFEEERPDMSEYHKKPLLKIGNDTLVTQKIPKDIFLHSKEGFIFNHNSIDSLLHKGKVIVLKIMSNPSISNASFTFNSYVDKSPLRDTNQLKNLIIINLFLDKPKNEKQVYKKIITNQTIEQWIKENKRKNLYNVVLADDKNVFCGYNGKKIIKDLCYRVTQHFPTLLVLSDGLIKQYSWGVIDFKPVFYYEIERAKEKYIENKY
ncbi:MAG: hypothetical protein EAY69_06430 [Cytophagales bacterium]|nr:MAG: hypothetical protein EAY69_06430 [Cytophagales bacterium]